MHRSLLRIISIGLILSTITTSIVYAGNTNIEITVSNNNQSLSDKVVSGIFGNSTNDLENQLDLLYKRTSDLFGMPYTYVKALHIICGGKAIYSNKNANIFKDTTSDKFEPPFKIDSIDLKKINYTLYGVEANQDVKRPSKYYLPDAAYTLTKEIYDIMQERLKVDRGEYNEYFKALLPETRQDIVFYEAIMEYCKSSDEAINNLYIAYEDILYSKDANENVVYYDIESDKCKFREEFDSILSKYNIDNKDKLAIAMSFDKNLAEQCNPDDLRSVSIMPYKYGHLSRENIMLASTSLVGKVRYVWGGGHGGTGNIRGISPIWLVFNDLYKENEKLDRSIRPNTCWCPIHNESVNTGNGCLFKSETVSSIKEYLSIYNNNFRDTINYGKLNEKNLKSIFSNGSGFTYESNSTRSINSHRLDGLDCSGFISWVFNQVDMDRRYDSNAKNFVKSTNMQEIEFGGSLVTGDVIAWSSHIGMIVGPVKRGSSAYVIVESSPNVVKFGTCHYSNASKEDINLAKSLAKEANIIFGDIENESVSNYNLESLRYNVTIDSDRLTERIDEETGEIIYEPTVIYNKSLYLGRLSKEYLDGLTGIQFKDMVARDIIQHTMDKMPLGYLLGYNKYEGGYYNIKENSEKIISTKE